MSDEREEIWLDDPLRLYLIEEVFSELLELRDERIFNAYPHEPTPAAFTISQPSAWFVDRHLTSDNFDGIE